MQLSETRTKVEQLKELPDELLYFVIKNTSEDGVFDVKQLQPLLGDINGIEAKLLALGKRPGEYIDNHTILNDLVLGTLKGRAVKMIDEIAVDVQDHSSAAQQAGTCPMALDDPDLQQNDARLGVRSFFCNYFFKKKIKALVLLIVLIGNGIVTPITGPEVFAYFEEQGYSEDDAADATAKFVIGSKMVHLLLLALYPIFKSDPEGARYLDNGWAAIKGLAHWTHDQTYYATGLSTISGSQSIPMCSIHESCMVQTPDGILCSFGPQVYQHIEITGTTVTCQQL